MCTRAKLSSNISNDNQRSDSPGYFTLSSNSDSDTGDCAGDISGEDDQFVQTRQQPHDRSFSQSRNDDNFANSSSSTIVYNFQALPPVSSNRGEDMKTNSLSSSQEEMVVFDKYKTSSGNNSTFFKSRNQHDDNSAPPSPPPRPPPPLSYTSTLPPPVPKKINAHGNTSRSHSVHQQRPSNVGVTHTFPRQPSAPPSSRTQDCTFQPKPKPLQRVQPLQIQSPSLINVLKQGMTPTQPQMGFSSSGCSGSSESTYNSSSEENPFSSMESQTHGEHTEPCAFERFDKPNTTITENHGNTGSRQSSYSPGDGMFHSRNSSTTDSVNSVLSNHVQTVNPQIFHSSNIKPSNIQRSFKKLDLNGENNSNQIEEKMHGNTSSNCTSRSNSPLSESSCRIVDNTSKSKKKSIRKGSNINKESTPSQSSSPLQNAKRCVLNKVTAFTKSKNKISRPKSRNEDSSNSNDDLNQLQIIFSNESSESMYLNPKFNEPKFQPTNEIVYKNSVDRKAKNMEANQSFISGYKNESLQKIELNNKINTSSQQQQKKRQTLHSSIYNLIKCYEPDFTRKRSSSSTPTDVRASTTKINRSRSSSSDRTTLSSIISNTVSARLSQLSIESLERINSWLSNPIDSSNQSTRRNTPDDALNSQDLSNKEIDILDQCVNDLIEFSQGTLEPNRSNKTSHPRYSIVELVQSSIKSEEADEKENDEPKLSVQQLVNKIEKCEKSIEVDELHTMVTLTPHQEDELIDCKVQGKKEDKFPKECKQFSNNETNTQQKDFSRSDRNGHETKATLKYGIEHGNNLLPTVLNVKNEIKEAPVNLQPFTNINISNSLGQFHVENVQIISSSNKSRNANNKNGLKLEDKTQEPKNIKDEAHLTSCSQSAPPNSLGAKKVPAPKQLLQSTGKQPIPSPRVKRKARKEKMLQEHKELGKQALSQLKDKHLVASETVSPASRNQVNDGPNISTSTCNNSEDPSSQMSTSLSYPNISSTCTTPSLALSRHSNSTLTDEDTLKTEIAEDISINNIEENDNGLDVLEDLCTQSKFIQRELTNTPSISLLNSNFSTKSINVNNQNYDVSEKSFPINGNENNDQQRTKVRISQYKHYGPK